MPLSNNATTLSAKIHCFEDESCVLVWVDTLERGVMLSTKSSVGAGRVNPTFIERSTADPEFNMECYERNGQKICFTANLRGGGSVSISRKKITNGGVDWSYDRSVYLPSPPATDTLGVDCFKYLLTPLL